MTTKDAASASLKNNMNLVFAIIAVLAMILADQASKFWVLEHLADGTVLQVLPGILQFRYVENTGMAFSLFDNQTWLLALFSFIVVVVLTVMLLKGKVEGKAMRAAVLMIIGGGIGNLIDRAFRHFVVDFIEVTFMNFAVFNVADCFVTVGCLLVIVLLLADIIRDPKGESDGK